MGKKLDKIKKAFKIIGSKAQAHGIPKIFNSTHIVMRVMWLMITIGSASVCLLCLTKTILDFLKYPVVTNINVKSEIPAEFPAIKICSLNPTIQEYSLSDRIIKCTFNGLTNCLNYFSIYFDENIQRICLKFNTDLPNPFTTAKPGIINGLIVNIFDGLFT